MSIVDTLRKEPVRLYLYGIAAAVIALLIGVGVVSTGTAPLIIAVIVAALAIPSPVESLRGKVSPVETTYAAKLIEPEDKNGY